MIMNLKSPAKINIGLRILNKRDDGFHNLETIFYPVRIYDDVFVSIRNADNDFNSIIIKSEKNSVPLNRNNTCFKIIENFFKEFRIKETYRFEIEIKKNIPIGGGLGGGSSNAGTLLRYLINYYKIDINENREKIMRVALSVGSDVPFFLIQKPCYATGRGEKLKLLKDFILNYDILLVNPNKHVSTKWAFENLNFNKSIDPILQNIEKFDINNKDIFLNDFEDVVFQKYSILKEVKDKLNFFKSSFSSLSGTGAVLYGLFEKSNYNKKLEAKKEFSRLGYFVTEA